ncbi:putative membrane protein [Candidatus Phytoplasma solani]
MNKFLKAILSTILIIIVPTSISFSLFKIFEYFTLSIETVSKITLTIIISLIFIIIFLILISINPKEEKI